MWKQHQWGQEALIQWQSLSCNPSAGGGHNTCRGWECSESPQKCGWDLQPIQRRLEKSWEEEGQICPTGSWRGMSQAWQFPAGKIHLANPNSCLFVHLISFSTASMKGREEVSYILWKMGREALKWLMSSEFINATRFRKACQTCSKKPKSPGGSALTREIEKVVKYPWRKRNCRQFKSCSEMHRKYTGYLRILVTVPACMRYSHHHSLHDLHQHAHELDWAETCNLRKCFLFLNCRIWRWLHWPLTDHNNETRITHYLCIMGLQFQTLS